MLHYTCAQGERKILDVFLELQTQHVQKSLLLEKNKQKQGPHPVFSFSVNCGSRKKSSYLDSLLPILTSYQLIILSIIIFKLCVSLISSLLSKVLTLPWIQATIIIYIDNKNDILLGHTFSLANSLQSFLPLTAMVRFLISFYVLHWTNYICNWTFHYHPKVFALKSLEMLLSTGNFPWLLRTRGEHQLGTPVPPCNTPPPLCQ